MQSTAHGSLNVSELTELTIAFQFRLSVKISVIWSKQENNRIPIFIIYTKRRTQQSFLGASAPIDNLESAPMKIMILVTVNELEFSSDRIERPEN